ncbi:MAG: hypothetical protein IM591_12965 [Chitinophagaceae bacterium]|nr:hypothetical protein [Chitinophagaceae bacterium]
MISREQAISTLKRTWRTQEFKFYAEFFRPKKEDGTLIKPRPGVNAYGFFRNLSTNDRKIFYPPYEALKYERNVSFKVNVVDGLEDGKYYYLELELEDDENRKENPFALKIKDVFILEEDHLSPKEFIELWFYKKGHTPGDAATIAGQLTLNELELYTHTKRFIFELIQNADDMPDGKKDVNIEINLLTNHLLFLHNGKYFDREDVKAISDAAKSTKSKSLSQTGYKGIGFKSVFTDSTRVYIKSGDYFFKFDKLEPTYKDFYLLYKGFIDNLTPKAKKEFEIEYKGREHEFTIIDKIPWQIKPIWVEFGTIPKELSTSSFAKNRQVSIALEISENILRQKDYDGMIVGLLKESRFLLFLRNTKGFKYLNVSDQSTNTIIDISIRERNDVLSVYNNEVLSASYIKHEFTININNDDFIRSGLNFKKREVEGGKIEFFDNEGNKLDNIPEKLGRLDKTVITLAAKIDRYLIEKLEKEDSILFNYLPTSDQRFGFPFLVNADFVSKTDREFIQIENKWNHYLFFHLGQKCIEWLSILSKATHEIQGKRLFSYAKTYLNLLPEKLLDENNKELCSINIAFNKGLMDAIQSIAIIIDNNGKIKKCDDIILDDTLISTVLGNGFFKQISKTKKELPLFLIDSDKLKKDYLNIERYNAEALMKEFSLETNREILTNALVRLNPEKYLEFIKWLDNFCNINDVYSNWILDLPIVRLEKSVLSLSEFLNNPICYLRLNKTSELESIFIKVGFNLSEFNIDDDRLKHLKAIVLQQDSYIKSDVKLYEHLAAAKDLSKLNAFEKNTLIAFFEGLVDVGPAKYAKALPLFKSKKKEGSLKPLNSLISNTCEGLPSWLNDFVINTDEENALGSTFQAQLLKEKELLEKLFCNSETYSEIITGINIDNVEEFYKYLLKLHDGKAEDFDLDTTIPWFFIESGLSFSKASDVYLPDSFTKLTKNKYTSVKAVIESISDEKLPHFSALQIKAPFALGGNNFQLAAITPKQNSFGVILVNDFLDWAESNGEKDLLQNLTSSIVDEKITIGKAIGTVAYYTTDLDLIKLIEASIFKAKLTIFPSELYTKERSKIGLLEDAYLLKFLLDEGYANIDLAKYIQSSNDPKLNLQFLENLVELNISTSKTYISEDYEFRILKLAIQYIVPDKDKLKSFKNKITIDGQPLLERAISEDVYFYDKNVGLKTKLSDILPSYKNRTFPLSEIIEKFNGFDDNKNLVAILKDEGRTPKKILKELNEQNPTCHDAAQTLFLSYYQTLYPDQKVLEGKIFFSAVQDVNNEEYFKELHRFLDYCLNEANYTEFVNQEIITDFNPDLLLAVDEYALDTEQLPGWLRAWVESKGNDEVQEFISKMGIKNESSPVVQLRKGLLGDATVNMDAARGGITKPDLLVNTFEWLLTKHNDRNYAASLLKPLYERALVLNISINTLPLPNPTDISCKTYQLYQAEQNDHFHLIWDGWGNHKSDVWNHLKKSGKIIIDELLPSTFLEELSPTKISASSELDTTNVMQNLRDCNLSFYKFWPEKDNYIIKIFKGSSLPRKIAYNDETISTFYEGFYEKVDKSHVVVESIENALPHSIRDHIPDFFDRLNSWKADFENNRTERKLSPEEEEAIMKLFDGVVPEEFRKNLNLAALASALVYLDGEGYDVYQANKHLIDTHEYAQLAPVYKDGVQYTVMCRSARLGLLYLTKKAWDRLDNQYDPNVMLFADKGYGEFELFRSKQAVLDVNRENPTDFQVMRIESRANASELDEMLQGKFEDASRLWIIFRLKGNEHFDKLFFERPETNNNPKNIINARTDDTGGY